MPDIVILAAQRTGVVNALAAEFGVSHKFLVPICGKPLLAHVLDVLAQRRDIGSIRICVEIEAFADVARLAAAYPAAMQISCVASRPGIADSVLAAAEGLAHPVLITTADNVLLSNAAIDDVLAALGHADVAFALASEAAVSAAHPEGQRRYYRLRDAAYANCNRYGLGTSRAVAAVQIFREGGQFMNNPSRLVRAFGIGNVLMMRLGLLPLGAAMRRVSARFGVRIAAVPMRDGAQAIDVDNRRTYDIAGPILAQRLAADALRSGRAA